MTVLFSMLFLTGVFIENPVYSMRGMSEVKEVAATADEVAEVTEEDLYIPEQDELVNVAQYIPDIFIDLRYATADNFTGKCIYNFSEAYLRYGTVQKLKKLTEEAAADGYSLKIWDAFRPVSAQYDLWEICPDSRYVANPNKGFSSHSRGNTVDITLVNADGSELEMPSDFDDFSARADRDYSDCTEEAQKNAMYLEQLMIENGFEAYFGEWWHYRDSDMYPVEMKGK